MGIATRETWLAWAAGIIEGEGCIALVRNKNKGCKEYYSLRIGVTNTDARLLCKFHKIVKCGTINKHGKTYKQHPTWKVQWRWSVTGLKAAELLQKLMPWFVSKRNQAKLAISYRAFLRHGKPNALFLDKQREIYHELSVMKHKLPSLENVGQNIPLVA